MRFPRLRCAECGRLEPWSVTLKMWWRTHRLLTAKPKRGAKPITTADVLAAVREADQRIYGDGGVLP